MPSRLKVILTHKLSLVNNHRFRMVMNFRSSQFTAEYSFNWYLPIHLFIQIVMFTVVVVMSNYKVSSVSFQVTFLVEYSVTFLVEYSWMKLISRRLWWDFRFSYFVITIIQFFDWFVFIGSSVYSHVDLFAEWLSIQKREDWYSVYNPKACLWKGKKYQNTS